MKKMIFSVLILLFTVPLYAEETLSKDDIIKLLLSGSASESFDKFDREDLIQFLKKEFGAEDEDLAFLSSVRGARLPYDGFDFFNHPKEFLQLSAIYFEAKKEWAKPITIEFYDFFGKYAEERVHLANWAEFHYQLEHAKKRFKLPLSGP